MIELLLIAAFCFWFAELSTIPQRFVMLVNIWHKLNNIKPFDCTKCLAFWFGSIYSFTFLHIHISLFYGGICSLIAVVFSRIYYKFLS